MSNPPRLLTVPRLFTASRAAGALGVFALLAAVSGCASSPASVDGSSFASAAPRAGAVSDAAKVTGGVLAPADVGGWTAAEIPKPWGADWLTLCGKGSGVAATQKDPKVSSFKLPSGQVAATRVAGYAAADGPTAALNMVSVLVTKCPVDKVGDVTFNASLLPGPASGHAVGVLVRSMDKAGNALESTSYWLSVVGDHSVEVAVRGVFTGGAQDPIIALSSQLLDAATSKATGTPVTAPVVPAAGPVLPRQSVTQGPGGVPGSVGGKPPAGAVVGSGPGSGPKSSGQTLAPGVKGDAGGYSYQPGFDPALVGQP